MPDSDKGTKITVDLGSVQLPEKVASELEVEIKRAVLGALAQVDLKRDILFGPQKFPPGTIGLILRDPGTLL